MNIFEVMFLQHFPNIYFSERTGMHNLFPFNFKLLLRPWDLFHRVERQKLMVTSREETVVRPKNGLQIEGSS